MLSLCVAGSVKMGKSPCSEEGKKKGAWTAQEDENLRDYITTHGEGKWRNVAKHTGLQRSGKSCRLRWLNYLRPQIKRGNISPDEEDLIIRLHKLLGNRWSLIAGRLPERTDNEIKNYWNTYIKRRLINGKQSDYHQQKSHTITSNETPITSTTCVSDMASTNTLKSTDIFVSTTQTTQHQVQDLDHNIVHVLEEPDKEGCPVNSNNTTILGSSSNDQLHSTSSEDDNSANFAGSFNMDEILMSDISGSDFWKLCMFDDSNNIEGGDENGGANINLCPSLDQTLLLSEDTLNDWIREVLV